jgi:hypothetical protein
VIAVVKGQPTYTAGRGRHATCRFTIVGGGGDEIHLTGSCATFQKRIAVVGVVEGDLTEPSATHNLEMDVIRARPRFLWTGCLCVGNMPGAGD